MQNVTTLHGPAPISPTFPLQWVVLTVYVCFSIAALIYGWELLDGSSSYERIASDISQGNGITDGYRPPLYPLFLAGLQILSGENWKVWACVMQCGLALGCCSLVMKQLRILQAPLAALVTFALLFIGNMLFQLEAITVRETILYAFLLSFLATILLSLRGRLAPPSSSMVLGTVAGLAHLTRPTGLFLLVVVLLMQLFSRCFRGRRVVSMLLSLCAFFLVVGPWQIHLSKIRGKATFTSSTTSEINLWKGNNRYFSELYPTIDLDSLEPWLETKFAASGVTRERFDYLLGVEARQFIMTRPGAFMVRSVSKLLVFFSPYPLPVGSAVLDVQDSSVSIIKLRTRTIWIQFFSLIHGIVVLAGAFVAIRWARTADPGYRAYIWLVVVLTGSQLFPYLVAFSETRFRLPLDPLFLGVAALGFSYILGRKKERTRRAGPTAVLFSLLICVLAAPAFAVEKPAFPGAAGFGSNTVGGSGRHEKAPHSDVFLVSSLADRGRGSLRECMEAKHPRTCVFLKSGIIRLSSPLKVRSPYLTVAGESAPAPGILLVGAGLTIAASDVLIRHVEIRVGDDKQGPNPLSRDGISIGISDARVERVLIDHVSISWAIDENLTIWGKDTRNITISNSIIAEGLHNSIHPKGPHSKGVMVSDDVYGVTLIGNVIAGNEERNPYLKPGSVTEVLNNVVYNWGERSRSTMVNLSDSGKVKRPVLLAFAGNYYLPGPTSFRSELLYGKPLDPGTRVYIGDNIGPTRPSEEGSPWLVSALPEVPHRTDRSPFPESGAKSMSPLLASQRALVSAGSRPRQRNPVDARIIAEIRRHSGSLKDCISGCPRAVGGWPTVQENEGDFVVPEEHWRDSDGDGYTNLENALHARAALIE